MMTRVRCGTSVKVTIAVRWLHSLVTSMIPSTGSRNAEVYAVVAMKPSKVIGSSWVVVTTSTSTIASMVSAPVTMSSHSPALVSHVLRSSTFTSRPKGTGRVEAMSIGPKASAVLMRGLLRR
jgi:hypothetical protein